MDKSFFSVIVPAHNSADYIQKGFASIRAQTFKDYELIVVCDNCTDYTDMVVEQFWPDKVITTNHGMDGLARNAGIDAAEGKWILFMDDDDWWIHEYVLEEIHAVITSLVIELDIVCFDFIWKGKGYFSNNLSGMNIAVWSKAFRREFIGDTRFPAIPFTSDKPFMDEICAKNPNGFAMHELMYYYNYMRDGSQTEQHARMGRQFSKPD